MPKLVKDIIKELQALPEDSEISGEIKVTIGKFDLSKTISRDIGAIYRRGNKTIISFEEIKMF
jgi:hypothetical protein